MLETNWETLTKLPDSRMAEMVNSTDNEDVLYLDLDPGAWSIFVLSFTGSGQNQNLTWSSSTILQTSRDTDISPIGPQVIMATMFDNFKFYWYEKNIKYDIGHWKSQNKRKIRVKLYLLNYHSYTLYRWIQISEITFHATNLSLPGSQCVLRSIYHLGRTPTHYTQYV